VRDVAQFLKALADESRLQMLWLLFNHEELCVCDIMDTLAITQSKTSRHLATLRYAGLVQDRKDAAWSYYSICPAKNEREAALLNTLRTTLANHADAARLLQALHAHLTGKERRSTCAKAPDRQARMAKDKQVRPQRPRASQDRQEG
jgi:ArsR family transcriptional regulator